MKLALQVNCFGGGTYHHIELARLDDALQVGIVKRQVVGCQLERTGSGLAGH